MKCCKCNAALTGQDKVCPSCGMPLKAYRRLVHMANSYYNTALECAKRKDLSGAIMALEQCLQLNKRQTSARNLYGLILFRLGEFGRAARQWKLSMRFDPEDHRAEELYQKAFGNRTDLARFRDLASKYNLALQSAKDGALDLAQIQLKNVLEEYPHYAKAAKLMALICLQQQDYARACRVLTPLLEINTTDTLAQYYMEEAIKEGGRFLEEEIEIQEEQEERERQEVIIPPYNEKNELLHDFLCIAGGLLLGILACMFLIFPSVRQRMIDENNAQIMSIGDNLSAKEVEIMSLESKLSDLTDELKQTQEKLEGYTGTNGVMSAYTNLIRAMNYFVAQDYLNASSAFTAIDVNAVSDSEYIAAYNMMNEKLHSDGLEQLFNQGYSLFKKYKYDEAVKYLQECVKLKPDYVEAYYWIGLCYYNKGDKETAKTYLYKVQKEYPDSVFASRARDIMPYDEQTETTTAQQ